MPDPARSLHGPWTEEPAIHAGAGTLTLIDGLMFAISGAAGDMGGRRTGLVAADTRHLSLLVLSIDGRPVETLGTAVLSPASARFHGAASRHGRDRGGTLEVTRQRTVDSGTLTDEITLDWWGSGSTQARVELRIGADFADIFDIRAGTRMSTVVVPGPADRGHITLDDPVADRRTEVLLDPAPDRGGEALQWDARVVRDVPWRLVLTARPSGAGLRPPARKVRRPRHGLPMVSTSPPHLGDACVRALGDLQTLSVPDDQERGDTLTAAGIPWFVALFGRDSLIAAHQARAFIPDAQLRAVRVLARRLGTVDDPANDEQPGKVLHEVRLTPKPWLGSGTATGDRPYFGSVDATPLFLMAFGEAFRWGAPREDLRALLPQVYAALSWLEGPGDPDGDGLIEYSPLGPRSLRNQGWKDSDDAVQFADGTLAAPPIAIAEAQGYAYRARRDVAAVLAFLGDRDGAARLERDAERVRTRARTALWCERTGARPGYFAMGLDRDKRRIDAVASNMGHLLWCGVPSAGESADVAAHLSGRELSSGWGVRTLARSMPGFDPISYHRGSVWPHDTAICIEGLRLYGHTDQAMGLAADLIGAMRRFSGRLPELFGGHTRRPSDVPVPYPTACRPQAWAAGVPLQIVTTCLGLRPDVPSGEVSVAPTLPDGVDDLTVRDLPLAGGVLSVNVRRGRGVRILEAPPGVALHVLPA